jgi:hypothetical protein
MEGFHPTGPVSTATIAELGTDLWPVYRKKVNTRAIRVAGPFTVETSEWPLNCEDGYLAVDARGYPYPIAADEFELIYEPVLSDQGAVPAAETA